MWAQKLKEAIHLALLQEFPAIPIAEEEDAPQDTPYFELGLLSAACERHREGRYQVHYRYRILYKQGETAAEAGIADRLLILLDTLRLSSDVKSPVRCSGQRWIAGGPGTAPRLIVGYKLELIADKEGQGGDAMMQKLDQKGRFK